MFENSTISGINSNINTLTGISDMSFAYNNCVSLQSNPSTLIPDWSNTNVTSANILNMFTNCTSLPYNANISGTLWRKSNANKFFENTYINCFQGCKNYQKRKNIPLLWRGAYEESTTSSVILVSSLISACTWPTSGYVKISLGFDRQCGNKNYLSGNLFTTVGDTQLRLFKINWYQKTSNKIINSEMQNIYSVTGFTSGLFKNYSKTGAKIYKPIPITGCNIDTISSYTLQYLDQNYKVLSTETIEL